MPHLHQHASHPGKSHVQVSDNSARYSSPKLSAANADGLGLPLTAPSSEALPHIAQLPADITPSAGSLPKQHTMDPKVVGPADPTACIESLPQQRRIDQKPGQPADNTACVRNLPQQPRIDQQPMQPADIQSPTALPASGIFQLPGDHFSNLQGHNCPAASAPQTHDEQSRAGPGAMHDLKQEAAQQDGLEPYFALDSQATRDDAMLQNQSTLKQTPQPALHLVRKSEASLQQEAFREHLHCSEHLGAASSGEPQKQPQQKSHQQSHQQSQHADVAVRSAQSARQADEVAVEVKSEPEQQMSAQTNPGQDPHIQADPSADHAARPLGMSGSGPAPADSGQLAQAVPQESSQPAPRADRSKVKLESDQLRSLPIHPPKAWPDQIAPAAEKARQPGGSGHSADSSKPAQAAASSRLSHVPLECRSTALGPLLSSGNHAEPSIQGGQPAAVSMTPPGGARPNQQQGKHEAASRASADPAHERMSVAAHGQLVSAGPSDTPMHWGHVQDAQAIAVPFNEAKPHRKHVSTKVRPVAVAHKPRRSGNPLKIARRGAGGAEKKQGGWKKRQRVPLVDCAQDTMLDVAHARPPVQEMTGSQLHLSAGVYADGYCQQDPMQAQPPLHHAGRSHIDQTTLQAADLQVHAGPPGLSTDAVQRDRQASPDAEKSWRQPQSGSGQHSRGHCPRPCNSTEAAAGVCGSGSEHSRRRSSPQSAHLPAMPSHRQYGQTHASGRASPQAAATDGCHNASIGLQPADQHGGAEKCMKDPAQISDRVTEAAQPPGRGGGVDAHKMAPPGEHGRI